MPYSFNIQHLSRGLCLLLAATLAIGQPLEVMAQSQSEGRRASRSISGSSSRSLTSAKPWVRPNPRDLTEKLKGDYFSVNGRLYHLRQRVAVNGRFVEQVLSSGDRVQISIDKNADGRLESWHLIRNGREITLRNPRKGVFQVMEVTQVLKGKSIQLKLIRNHEGNYQLFSSRTFPGNVMSKFLDAPMVGCRPKEQDLHDKAAKINTMLAEGKLADDDLYRLIRNEIMDSSCLTGEFAPNTDKMVKAVMTVFKSEVTYTDEQRKKQTLYSDESTKRAERPTQPRFLACLRHYNLDTHAARIESGLNTYVNDPKNQVYRWRIRCEAREGCNSAKKTLQRGEYEHRDGAHPVVSFIRDKNCGNTQFENSIEDLASTFFHEMLHYSNINDDYAATIEECCRQTDPKHLSCKNLETYLRARIYSQRFENRVAELKEKRYDDYQAMVGMGEILYGIDGFNKNQADFLEQLGTVQENVAITSDECLKSSEIHRRLGDASDNPYALTASCKADSECLRATRSCIDDFKKALRPTVEAQFDIPSCTQKLMAPPLKLSKSEAERYCRAYQDNIIRLMAFDKDQFGESEKKNACAEIVGKKTSRYDRDPLRFRRWQTLWLSRAFAVPVDVEQMLMERMVKVCSIEAPNEEASNELIGNEPALGDAPRDISAANPANEAVNSTDEKDAVGNNASTEAPPTIQTAPTQGQNIEKANRASSEPPRPTRKTEPVIFARENQGPPIDDLFKRQPERIEKITEYLEQQRKVDTGLDRYFKLAEKLAENKAQASEKPSLQQQQRDLRQELMEKLDPKRAQMNDNRLVLPDPLATSMRVPSGVSSAAASGAAAGRLDGAALTKASRPATPVAEGPRAPGKTAAPVSSASPSPSPAQSSDRRPSQESAQALRERGRAAFIAYLKTLDDSMLAKELKKISVQKALRRERIKLITADQKIHGEIKRPLVVLVYDPKSKRLIETKAPERDPQP